MIFSGEEIPKISLTAKVPIILCFVRKMIVFPDTFAEISHFTLANFAKLLGVRKRTRSVSEAIARIFGKTGTGTHSKTKKAKKVSICDFAISDRSCVCFSDLFRDFSQIP